MIEPKRESLRFKFTKSSKSYIVKAKDKEHAKRVFKRTLNKNPNNYEITKA